MSKQFEATLVDGASAAGARAALVVTAVMQRTLFRYQHRGYRYVMNDVGAIMQSFSMVGAALGLETAGHGDFFDDELAALIGVNSVDEAVAMALIIRGGPGHVSMGYP
jgi:SagB-type dehydrogenase family enzyme